jgi:hypothetical protein
LTICFPESDGAANHTSGNKNNQQFPPLTSKIPRFKPLWRWYKTSIVEGGAPLGKTKRVDSNGASNTRNEIGGYSVVQAESHDAATKIFGKDHPHLQMPGAWIEIVEIMPMPGM